MMSSEPVNQEAERPEEFEIFPWNDKFNTGHERIDEQHRTLARLVNRVARTLIDQDYSVVSSTFDELAKYAHLHFMDEESVWLQYFDEDDPWFSSHQHSTKASGQKFTRFDSLIPKSLCMKSWKISRSI